VRAQGVKCRRRDLFASIQRLNGNRPSPPCASPGCSNASAGNIKASGLAVHEPLQRLADELRRELRDH
jgi:hypothetical protein